RPWHRPAEQDPRLRAAGRRRRYRGGQRAPGLRRRPARLLDLPADARPPGHSRGPADDQQPAQGQGPGRLRRARGRAPSAGVRPQPAQPQVPGDQGRQARPHAGAAAPGRSRVTRAEVRRRLALEWWRWLGFALAPLFFLNLLFGDSQALGSVLEMPLFIAALASMFVSLPLFSAYKRALIATQAALDGEHEREAWLELA